MARSTQAQKAKILNAAYRLLSRQMSTAQAAAVLSRERAISLRQAYRYLEQAAQLDGLVMVAEPALPITFKIPGNVIRTLRAHAAANDLTLSEVVTRAITQFVARASGHG
jgi:hypothetical protein